jgi:hypothetical protein
VLNKLFMKKIFFLVLIIACLKSFSQNVAINTTGNAANASAMLDVSANNKGLLIPRMTTTERQAIASPANGLMVFDVTTNTFWYFSTTWKEIGSGGGAGFTLPYSGNATNATATFSITNPSLTVASSAIYGRNGNSGSGFIPLYSMGVWGDNSTGVGVAGSSNNIGVLGITNGNNPNGIGVKGVNGSGTFAAVTGENSSSGGGVRGVFTGSANSLGYGVIGETGMNGNIGVAGKFISNNPNDPTNTLWSLNYGLGEGLTVTMNNAQNNSAAIDVNHSGIGNLVHLLGQNNAEFTVANNGNTTTSGIVIVRGNKGIIRNSGAAQMRVETVSAAIQAGGISMINNELVQIDVTFNTAFSSAPKVYVANVLNMSFTATYLIASVSNVTTTGCRLYLRNVAGHDLDGITGSWQLVAMGAE